MLAVFSVVEDISSASDAKRRSFNDNTKVFSLCKYSRRASELKTLKKQT